MRVLNIIVGLAALTLGIVVVIFPDLGIEILIFILAIGLMLQGIARITVGGSDTDLPTWFRSILIILGVLSIFLSFIVIVFPTLGYLSLIFLLAWGFLLTGIGRIAVGVSGYMILEEAS